MIKIQVIITCFRDPKNVSSLINSINKNAGFCTFKFFVAIYQKQTKIDLPKFVSTFLFDKDFYWAESVMQLINLSKNENFDYCLHINEDLILNENSFKHFLNLIKKEKIDVFFGVISNPKEKQNIFGLLKYKYYFKPEVVQGRSFNMEFGESFNGNFFAFKKELISLFNNLPNYSHSYLDLHFSLLAKRNGFNIRTIPKPIGFTEETLYFRKKFVRKNHGIFSKSRSNILDKFYFFKFKGGIIFSIIICSAQLIKLNKS